MIKNRRMMKELLAHIGALDYIDPNAFPDIDLYMDQVTTFMESHLEHCKRYPDDKILTKTMINNYAKNDLLPPPEKKKYTKDHLVIMTLIYYYKNLLSISDIQTILTPLADFYFDKGKEGKGVEDVYRQIYDLCMAHRNTYMRDLIKSCELVDETFDEEAIADPEEREFMTKFSLLCLLGFDMYIKKVAMEKIVDDMRAIKAKKDRQAEKANDKKRDAKEKKQK